MNKFIVALALLAAVLFCTGVQADPAPLGVRPAFRVPEQIAVVSDALTLGTIARFSDGDPGFAELLKTLKETPLGPAPAPGTQSEILGVSVLDAIRQRGITLESVGYSIPRVVRVERRGRTLTQSEVVAAVRNTLWQDPRLEMQVRDVQWQQSQIVPTGSAEIKIERLGAASNGRLPIRVDVTVNGDPAARFLATALVDEWREVPVLKREIERGMLINPDDIEVVRLNLSQGSGDVAVAPQEVIGKKAKLRMNAGEAIRRAALDLPPTIPKGKQIKVRLERGALIATMLGTAVEDGFLGQEVKVQNTSSKKILSGLVRSEDEVEVQQ